MSTEEIREEFEAWYLVARSGPDLDPAHDLKLDGDGVYYYQETFLMWKAWQASRAAIEVEFPPVWEQGANSAIGQACAQIRTADIQAIESLGLKVKP
jgi:hypothetical protein